MKRIFLWIITLAAFFLLIFLYLLGAFPPSPIIANIASFIKTPILCSIVPKHGWDSTPRNSCYWDVANSMSNAEFQKNNSPVYDTNATDACEGVTDKDHCYAIVASNVRYLGICNTVERRDKCYYDALRQLSYNLSFWGQETATVIDKLSCEHIEQKDAEIVCNVFNGSIDIPSHCEDVSDEDLRSYCHTTISGRVSSVQDCDAMLDERAEDSCIFRFAISLAQVHLCNNLNDRSLVNACRSQTAIKNKLPIICFSITDDEALRKDCLSYTEVLPEKISSKK